MRHATKIGLLVGCVLLLGATGARAQDWPQWRGPNRDNKVTGFTEPKTWPKELTKKWSVKVGLGDASPVLVGDKVYTFTRDGGDEIIRCLDAAKGTEVWSDKYATQPATGAGGKSHDGPRSSPAVADGKVCTLGVRGIVSCLDAEKGTVLWRKDTKEWPGFFLAASPIIVDGKCIVQIGGDSKGALVAYDLANGEEKWKWNGDGVAYASPVLMTIDKMQQLVTVTKKSLVGLSAADGKLLWKVSFSGGYNSVTPVVDGQTVYYGGERAGTIALKVEKKDDKFTTNELWKKSREGPGKYNTPMLKDGLLYGITEGGNLYCMKAETGDVPWTDKTARGGCGAVLDAGTVLLGLTSKKELFVFKPNGEKYEEIAKYKVADSDTWAMPIISGNRVFVKDKDTLTLWTIE